MSLRLTVALLLAALVASAADRTAARLVAEAKRAQNDGQVVRAYLLYSEAAARDPQNASYAVQRDALKPLAKLLTQSNVQDTPSIAEDIRAAESDAANQSLPDADSIRIPANDASLLPVPEVGPQPGIHSFDIHADDRTLLTQVAYAYGVDARFDPSLQSRDIRRFSVDNMDFATAMSAATAVTGTFAFALGPHRIFVAQDTEAKRSEFEPQTIITVDVPNAMDQRAVIEAASAIRVITGLHGTIAWSNTEHRIIIRDQVTRARAAAAVLEELVLPKAQVSFDVQLMSVDSDVLYTYGINWQTAYQILPLGVLSRLTNPSLPSLVNATTFLPFGGGASLFGIGLADASFLATYSASSSNVLYDATVLIESGGTATFHVGDQYPVATSLYSGAGLSANSPAAYNPIGQVTQENLGLSLKLAPRVITGGLVSLDLEAEYETLGNSSVDTVPTIDQRSFKGSLSLEEGQLAVIGGMDEDDHTVTRQGFPVLGDIPFLDLLFGQTTREHRKSQTLLLVKPTITRLALSSESMSAFLIGPQRGSRTIF